MQVPSETEVNDLEIPIPESFTGYNPFDELEVYQRNLPHWRQPGASYFVTFRTADSIPEEVQEETKNKADEWEEILKTSRKRHAGKVPENLLREFRMFQRRAQATLERLLDDCAGACLLRKAANLSLLSKALRFFDDQRYDLFAAVIMPNHCHVVIKPDEAFELESILASWKSFTARRMVGRREEKAPFWQSESFDRIIRDEAHYRKSVRYILKNPVKARLPLPECWLYARGVEHDAIHGLEAKD